MPESTTGDAPLFRWQTLREVRHYSLPYEQPVPGILLEVELATGVVVSVFRADDRAFYFCHGLAFGGKEAPGGSVSPFSGPDVLTILAEFFQEVSPESLALKGDLLVWYDADRSPFHSAILMRPIRDPGGPWLDYESELRSKNGRSPESTFTLTKLIGLPCEYGESYRVFRRK